MERTELRELIALLTSGEADETELEALTDAVENAESDPDLEFMREMDADTAWYRRVALLFALADYTASSDKIDELHEQISDQFADPLPAFPVECESTDHYFEWLDSMLAARGAEQGGYRLLTLDAGLDDSIVAFVVRRADAARILELSAIGHVRIEPASIAP